MNHDQIAARRWPTSRHWFYCGCFAVLLKRTPRARGMLVDVRCPPHSLEVLEQCRRRQIVVCKYFRVCVIYGLGERSIGVTSFFLLRFGIRFHCLRGWKLARERNAKINFNFPHFFTDGLSFRVCSTFAAIFHRTCAPGLLAAEFIGYEFLFLFLFIAATACEWPMHYLAISDLLVSFWRLCVKQSWPCSWGPLFSNNLMFG